MSEDVDIKTAKGRKYLSALFRGEGGYERTESIGMQLHSEAINNTFAKGYHASFIPPFIEAVRKFLEKHEEDFAIQGEVHHLQHLLYNIEL